MTFFPVKSEEKGGREKKEREKGERKRDGEARRGGSRERREHTHMCYSEDASITAFVVCMLSCSVLAYVHAPLAAFFAFVGLMQLLDYVFWTHLSENPTNYAATKVAMLLNHLQPLVLGLVLSLPTSSLPTSSSFAGSLSLPALSVALLAAYGVCAVAYSAVAWRNIDYTLVRPSSKPGLRWQWNAQNGAPLFYALFLATMVVVAAQGLAFPVNLAVCAIVLVSFFFSFVMYGGRSVIGRFWCHFAAYTPLIVAVAVSSAPAVVDVGKKRGGGARRLTAAAAAAASGGG